MAKATGSGGTADTRALRVAIRHIAADAADATELSNLLTRAGLEVVADTAPQLDGVVALISREALSDPGWLSASHEPQVGRMVPVRVGPVDDDRVPERLRELNWIDWMPENPATTVGFVLAGLFADPELHRMSCQLSHETETWVRAGRSDDLLIDDYNRARRMRELLSTLEADPLASPSAMTAEFVEASYVKTRRARRRRRRWRIGAAVALLAALFAAATLIPQIKSQSRINRAAIVTTGDQGILEDLPDWAAVNASALMIEGTDAQRDLGRATLLQAMGHRWAAGYVTTIDSVTGLTPLAGGERGAVLAQVPSGSAFALVDVPSGQTLWWTPLPKRYEQVAVTADKRKAVVAGQGVGVVDLGSRRFTRLSAEDIYVGARTSGTTALLWTDKGRLEARSLGGDTTDVVGEYEKVLDAAPDGRGGGTGLVATASGRYAIVAIPSGATIATARIPAGRWGHGALSPDGHRAIVDGADSQLWMFGAGRAAQPTGVPVPRRLADLAWAHGERIVLASDSERGQVVQLPDGQQLGHVCGSSPSVTTISIERDSDMVACGGDLRSFWTLPRGPRPGVGGLSGNGRRSRYATVEIRDHLVRIRRRGPLGSTSTGWSNPFSDTITASAFSPVGRQVALGSATGGVVVVGLTRRRAPIVVSWKVPDSSPIIAVGWDGRGFAAATARGETWSVPGCLGCETDAGLLAAATVRFKGCFTERQLTFTSDDVRRRLQLDKCPPIAVLEEN